MKLQEDQPRGISLSCGRPLRHGVVGW